MSHNRITFCLFLLLALIVSGCITFPPVLSPSATNTHNQLLPTLTLPFTQSPTPTLASTFTPTSLPSFTPMPPSPSFTYTTIPSTPTQTLTPAPTLTEAQRKAYFGELLQDNAGCRLPCWWGITPGVSTWEELRSLILHIGFRVGDDPMADGTVYHGTGYDWHPPLITNIFGFYDVMGIVEAINIYAEGYTDKNNFRTLWNSYSPDQILATYGQPTDVYVRAGQGVGGTGAGIVLKYDDEFMLIFKADPLLMEVNGESIFRICPSWQDITWEPELYMFIKSADYPLSLEEYMNLISSYSLEQFLTIEEAASINVDEFYQRFLPGSGPACFDTPQDIWR